MPYARLAAFALAAFLLAVPAGAHAAAPPYALTLGVAGLRGSVVADVSLVQAAAGEAPATELYGGTGRVVLGLRKGTRPTTPVGRLRWRPGAGGTIAVPASLRFAWNELAGPVDATRPKRRCQGVTRTPRPRRLVHVLRAEREGERVRVRWAVPLPRLGQAGCAGAGPLPRVVAEDVYPADTFDHQRVRLTVTGSHRARTGLPGGRSRSVLLSWSFELTLVRISG
jgi:hypothetical protein